MWQVELGNSVKRKLKQIPEPDKERLKEAIRLLRDTPEALDIKKLVGRDDYRLRVGKWRFLMDIDEKEKKIIVNTLASRGEVYKNKK
ncbi:MAG: type II toxin-antitoxin system RelE/ParE family toxin [Synergistaceae bacterium]|nr:type II toxin-antitoxin system RelE/ParE family toxin [Synergistaceae bacterium]